jgi:hypothetical protein
MVRREVEYVMVDADGKVIGRVQQAPKDEPWVLFGKNPAARRLLIFLIVIVMPIALVIMLSRAPGSQSFCEQMHGASNCVGAPYSNGIGYRK